MKQGVEIGIPLIADALNDILSAGGKTLGPFGNHGRGKGSEVGRSFEELRAILDRVGQKERMGVCLDTCHVYDGGYDIIGDLDGVLQVFDDIIGLDRLKAIHLNDSKNPIGSHKDRHEKIGEGTLGLAGIANIINHPKLCHLPFYLGNTERGGGLRQRDFLLKSLREENKKRFEKREKFSIASFNNNKEGMDMATPHISCRKGDFAKNSIDARRPFTGEIHCGNISDRCRGGQPHPWDSRLYGSI